MDLMEGGAAGYEQAREELRKLLDTGDHVSEVASEKSEEPQF